MSHPIEQLRVSSGSYKLNGQRLRKNLDLTKLLPVPYAGETLSPALTSSVIAALLHGDAAVMTLLKQHNDAETLDRYMLHLLDYWQGVVQEPTLQAAAKLGGAGVLAWLIAKAQRQANNRSTITLRIVCEALLATRNPAALLCIYHLWLTAKWDRHERALTKLLTDAALAQQISMEALGDTAVPDLAYAGRKYDYGARKFKFVFRAGLTPAIEDQHGRIQRSLPRPNRYDDPVAVNAAQQAWSADKASAEMTRSVQITLLERAMSAERLWSRGEFETVFMQSPFMRHLAKLLMWGVYDEAHTLIASFRPNDEGSFETATFDRFQLPAAARIGIVHPLHLSEADRAAWGNNLRDDQLIQPFSQLARTLYPLTDAEQTSDRIMRFDEWRNLPGARFYARSGMVARGWTRLRGQANIIFARYFSGSATTAILEIRLTGRGTRYNINHLAFFAGIPDEYPGQQCALHLVRPVVISEALYDVLTCIQRVGR